MNNHSDALKKKILQSWDQMKGKYPIVVNKEIVVGDQVKEDFLRYVDGLRSGKDIMEYFGLSPSEAHLIFNDLLGSGAIRFLDDTERLSFLKRQNSELKSNINFLSAERDKLSGEELYLNKGIEEKEKAIAITRERIPLLKKSLEEIDVKLKPLRDNPNAFWESNTELMGLLKDMKIKEEKIGKALERVEYEFPKIMKRKIRNFDKLRKVEEKVDENKGEKERLEKRLYVYRDAIDDVKDYLEETRGYIEHLIKE